MSQWLWDTMAHRLILPSDMGRLTVREVVMSLSSFFRTHVSWMRYPSLRRDVPLDPETPIEGAVQDPLSSGGQD